MRFTELFALVGKNAVVRQRIRSCVQTSGRKGHKDANSDYSQNGIERRNVETLNKHPGED